jgi:hypothetical protein
MFLCDVRVANAAFSACIRMVIRLHVPHLIALSGIEAWREAHPFGILGALRWNDTRSGDRCFVRGVCRAHDGAERADVMYVTAA